MCMREKGSVERKIWEFERKGEQRRGNGEKKAAI